MPAAAPPARVADIIERGQNSFSAMRLALALAVLVSHSYWLVTGQTAGEPLYAWTGHSLGEHAVQVFFFLSGVMVAQSLLTRGDLVDYACGRVLRILPGLIVCVLLTALALGPALSSFDLAAYLTDKALPAYFVKTLSLSTGSAPLPGLFTALPVPGLVNLSLWTLKFEVLCYLLLAGFGLAWLRLERFRPVLAAALALAVATAFIGDAKPAGGYSTFDNVRYFFLFFFAGTLAYLWRERIVLGWLYLLPLVALFIMAIGTRWMELATAACLGYGALLVASLSWGKLRAFADRHDYSYGVYIYACPLQQALIELCPGIGIAELTLVAIAPTLGLAGLSFELVERPAMRRREALAAWLRERIGNLAIPRPQPAGVEQAPPAFDSHAPALSRVTLATRHQRQRQ
jgi:peptidoglycan/LPS O-acetylase OafA/YrhL